MKMKLAHIVDGEEVNGEALFFRAESPFFNYRIQLSRLLEEHVEAALDAARSAIVQPIQERKRLLRTLADFEPSDVLLESMVKMLGKPIALIKEEIERGKQLAVGLADLEVKEQDSLASRRPIIGNRIASAAIPHGTAEEAFYFYAHFLLAGTPAITKLSAESPLLGREIDQFLISRGLSQNYFGVIYAQSSNPRDSELFREMMQKTDVPIVMGMAYLSPNQISFNADYSRGLVLDADAAIPLLAYSVLNPRLCMTDHNLIVVGKQNYDKIVVALRNLYANLREGDLMDPRTQLGLTDRQTLEEIASMIEIGRFTDTMSVLYPDKEFVTPEDVATGVVVEHYSEDPAVGANPMMSTVLPAYITGVRYVETFEDAIRDLRTGRNAIMEQCGKSMALGVYGDVTAEQLEPLYGIAHDLSVNKSPVFTDGVAHQGIKLHEVLTNEY
jgi:acyl-CoA reductase-like NAD-dependent aldehyde dehydrogenase